MPNPNQEIRPHHPEISYQFLRDATPGQIRYIIGLYRGAGWWVDTLDNAALVGEIVCGSFLFLAALSDRELIGMGRAISDGVSDAYIQDVVVNPRYQGRGIGSQLIRLLVKRLWEAKIGWIGLIAEKNTHPFYTRLGFKAMAASTPMLMAEK